LQHFSKLQVWQRSHKLVLDIYRASSTFPNAERFGLTSQLRRATLSVPTNIAEGPKRKSGVEFARFLNIAEGSLSETEYLLIVSRDLGYLKAELVAKKLQEVSEILRMLNGLRRKLSE
jgi:four helix bundle protein